MGAAYKPKDRSRSPGLWSTNVQYGWMKYQVRQGGARSLRCWRLGIPAPLAASLEPTEPSRGGEGSTSPLTEFWDEAGWVDLFAKALAKAMDTGFVFEDTPHRAYGRRFSVDLGL